VAFALEQVHTIEAKCFDLDDCFAFGGCRLGDLGDVQGGRGTGFVFDICVKWLERTWREFEVWDIPTARIFVLIVAIIGVEKVFN